MTPDKALDLLKEGNGRFVAGKSVRGDLPAQVRATAKGQYPFAAVLSCMDSRVPAELIFDTKVGDVFSLRVAGNVVDTDILGSLEFATKVAGAKLILVLGHTQCGAVKGAIDGVKLGNLTDLLAKIEPAVAAAGPGTSQENAYVNLVADKNVHLAMRQLLDRSPILQSLVASGSIRLAGAVYDIETGKVTFFRDQKKSE